jgi:hypothetical protein
LTDLGLNLVQLKQIKRAKTGQKKDSRAIEIS